MIKSIIKNNRANKIAAMEMSVGTIVTIVLLMAVLVLGLTLTKGIFSGASDSINSIDDGVKNEINEMFEQDDLKKVVAYPGTSISLKKGGNERGFAFSIRNVEGTTGDFEYEINSVDSDCNIPLKATADEYISLGRTGDAILILPGNKLENPIMVKFSLPDNAPPCEIRYRINVKRNNVFYEFLDVDIKIISR